ncbi:MAG: hypothetical protein JKY45_02520 [Emcibacter sp.]|nr:hypothetical protein [Emcibacter sp.]
MSMTTNPFTETDILNLALSSNAREHAIARLKNEQCMKNLREDNAKLLSALNVIKAIAHRATDLDDMACRICGCTHFTPCDPPCAWAEPGLCTACKDKAI